MSWRVPWHVSTTCLPVYRGPEDGDALREGTEGVGTIKIRDYIKNYVVA